MFGDVKFTPVTIQLTDAVRATMENRSSVHEPFKADHIWRTPNGSFFLVDEVIGKHEHIKYAIDINVDGVKTRDGDVWPCFKILQITNFN